MDKKTAKLMWTVILVFEVIIFIAMLLCDFGLLNSKFDPHSVNGIIYHAVPIVLIVISIDNIRKLK